MRYSLLLAALAAGVVNAVEKRVYVTDWSTVTITTTITAPTVTETIPAVQKAPAVVVETETSEPAPVETSSPTTDLFKKSTVPPDPATTSTVQPQPEEGTTYYWSSAWTSTIEPAEPSTTLATSTSSTSTSSSSTTSAASSTGSATTEYQQKVLYNHNIHRSNHSVSSLDWDDDLRQSAQTLAARCVYEHDTDIDGGGYGQNIGYGVQSNDVGVMITNMMYNDEIEFFPTPYGQADPSMSEFDSWGHFSQIVWKATTHVGCATVVCDSLGNVDSSGSVPFTVCNYSPVGNVGGEYGENVLKPGNSATYTAS